MLPTKAVCIIAYVIFFIQISLAELQSLLSELEGRIEGQAANIESLTATLKTKDEIISVSFPYSPIKQDCIRRRNFFSAV